MAAKIGKKQQKVIDELSRRVSMVREFMNDWLLFNQILSAYPSPGVNKAQLENQFLKVKSKLAREHNVLKDAIQSDYKIDKNTMQIVATSTNLESIYSQSEVAVKKLQGEWHRSFISINETLGQIEDKKGRAEGGEKIQMEEVGGVQLGGGGGGMSDKAKTNMAIAVVLIAVVAGVLIFTPFGQAYVDSFKSMLR
ncbi:MAG TPA: hypothetical protein EYN96_11595 [Candidatus Hydrogenedentes bacterium]|nr:hypothetical protein [Candidatus Hydrogenedentota bacterium]